MFLAKTVASLALASAGFQQAHGCTVSGSQEGVTIVDKTATCGSCGACQDATITGCDKVVCESETQLCSSTNNIYPCEGATLVDVKEVECLGLNSCEGATMNTGLDKVICQDTTCLDASIGFDGNPVTRVECYFGACNGATVFATTALCDYCGDPLVLNLPASFISDFMEYVDGGGCDFCQWRDPNDTSNNFVSCLEAPDPPVIPPPSPPPPPPPAPTPPTSPGETSGETSGGKRRRRLSSTALIIVPDDNLYKAHLDKCSGYMYDISVHIDPAPHLYATGKPREEALAAGCPYAATHAITYDDGSYVKELLAFENKADFEAMFPPKDSFPVGVFNVSQLEQAFQNTAVSQSSTGVYHVINNNCGAYLTQLGLELGVKVNEELLSFVTRRLISYSSKELLDNIRSSASSLFGGRNLHAITNDQVIATLVQEGISSLN